MEELADHLNIKAKNLHGLEDCLLRNIIANDLRV